MSKIEWNEQFDTGIDVIDQQHRRIVEYINQLDDLRLKDNSRDEIAMLINNLVDYTMTHFAFEESLQEEANYPYIAAHKKVHDQFRERVAEYQARFNKGENVTRLLNSMLVTWLLNHIKRDDADFAEVVRNHLKQKNAQPASAFDGMKKILFKPLF